MCMATKSSSPTAATCGSPQRLVDSPRASPRILASNFSPSSLPTASGSPSPDNTTATNRFTSFPSPAAFQSNSPFIRLADRSRRAGVTTIKSMAGRPTASPLSSVPAANISTWVTAVFTAFPLPAACLKRFHAQVRRRRSLSRRLQSRVLSALPRFPHLETLLRRLGTTALYF